MSNYTSLIITIVANSKKAPRHPMKIVLDLFESFLGFSSYLLSCHLYVGPEDLSVTPHVQLYHRQEKLWLDSPTYQI